MKTKIFRLILAVLIIIQLSAVYVGASNIVENGGFENGPMGFTSGNGWNNPEWFSISDLDPRSGASCLKMGGELASWPAIRQMVSVTPGETYVLSVWYKCLINDRAAAIKLLRDSNNGTSVLSESQFNFPSASSWTLFSEEFIVPAGVTQLCVYLTAAASGTYLDDLSIAEKTNEPEPEPVTFEPRNIKASNLIVNPAFSTDSGWNNLSDFTVSEAASLRGNALVMENQPAGTNISQTLEVAEKQTYYLRYSYTAAGTTAGSFVTLKSGSTKIYEAPLSQTSARRDESVTVVMPEDITDIEVVITYGGGGIINITNLSLVERVKNQEFVLNSGFEDGMAFWTANDTKMRIASDDKRSGEKSLYVQGTNPWSPVYQSVNIDKYSHYRAGLWGKVNTTDIQFKILATDHKDWTYPDAVSTQLAKSASSYLQTEIDFLSGPNDIFSFLVTTDAVDPKYSHIDDIFLEKLNKDIENLTAEVSDGGALIKFSLPEDLTFKAVNVYDEDDNLLASGNYPQIAVENLRNDIEHKLTVKTVTDKDILSSGSKISLTPRMQNGLEISVFENEGSGFNISAKNNSTGNKTVGIITVLTENGVIDTLITQTEVISAGGDENIDITLSNYSDKQVSIYFVDPELKILRESYNFPDIPASDIEYSHTRESISVIESDVNILEISQNAANALLFILNNDTSKTELNFNDISKDNIRHIAQTKVISGKYGFDFSMATNDSKGGYPVIISEDGNIKSRIFYYYSASDLNAALTSVNNSSTAAGLLALYESPYETGKYSQLFANMGCMTEEYEKLSDKNVFWGYILAEKAKGNFTQPSFVESFNNFVSICRLNQTISSADLMSILENCNSYLSLPISENSDFYKLSDNKSAACEAFIEIKKSTIISDKATALTTFNKAVALAYVNISDYTLMKDTLTKYQTDLSLNLSQYNSLAEYSRVLVDKELTGRSFKTPAELSSALSTAILGLSNTNNTIGQGGISGGGGSGGSGGSGVMKTDYIADPPAENKLDTEIFSDINQALWAQPAIEFLYSKNIINGDGTGNFNPNLNITREEFVKMLVLSLNLQTEGNSCDFNDVEADKWYYNYVAAAYKNGITNGDGSGGFGIGRNITREEMAAMIYNWVSKNQTIYEFDITPNNFYDSEMVSGYATDAVNALKNAEIINGMGDGNFEPKSNATRAQAVKIIYQLIMKIY